MTKFFVISERYLNLILHDYASVRRRRRMRRSRRKTGGGK
jgi:hypothetical protein